MDLQQAMLQRAGAAGPSKAVLRVAFIRKVYGLFTASLLVCCLTAMVSLYAGASSPDEATGGAGELPPVVALFAAHPLLSMALTLGVMFGARALRQVPDINVLALFGMAAILGWPAWIWGTRRARRGPG